MTMSIFVSLIQFLNVSDATESLSLKINKIYFSTLMYSFFNIYYYCISLGNEILLDTLERVKGNRLSDRNCGSCKISLVNRTLYRFADFSYTFFDYVRSFIPLLVSMSSIGFDLHRNAIDRLMQRRESNRSLHALCNISF